MKLVTIVIAVCLSLQLQAQHVSCTSTSFTISGAIKQQKTITISALDSLKAVAIPDLEITNHKGEKKSVQKGLKGILLKELLKEIEYNVEPKLQSELYFVFTACDGYKVVYSWNELFNSATGNSVYLVSEKETIAAAGLKESMLIVNCSDFSTGRRFIKGLASIVVYRAL